MGLFRLSIFRFLFLAFGFLIPIYYLLESLNRHFWPQLVSSSTIYTVVQTLIWSGLALFLIAVFAVPLALWLHQNRHSRYHRVVAAIQLFCQITWVLPGFVFAFLTLFVLKILGVVELYSLTSVLLAWVLAGTPFVATGLLVVLNDLDPREVEAMQTLGAEGIQLSRFYFLPKIRPALASVLFHQAWLLLTSFSIVALLNGGPPHETLEVAIYNSVRMDHVD